MRQKKETSPKKRQGIRSWFSDLSLSGKIVFLVCIIGFLPLGAVLTFSVAEIRRQSEESQIYALEQGYNQVSQVVEDKLSTHQLHQQELELIL